MLLGKFFTFSIEETRKLLLKPSHEKRDAESVQNMQNGMTRFYKKRSNDDASMSIMQCNMQDAMECHEKKRQI